MPSNQTPSKLDQLIQFVTSELRPECKWTIQDEYPQVFNQKNIHNLKYLEQEGQPVTHAALKPTIIRTPQMVLKVGALGSVVTDPLYRGQGLSSQVLMECLEEAKKQDCDIAILWTNLHGFYRKLGFELCGFEEYFVISKPFDTVTTDTSTRFIETNKVDPDAILRLFNKHTITSFRSTDDIRKYLTIPNSKVYTLWSQGNDLLAYAVLGKGADLQGFAHEWGGNINDLLVLFNHILASRKEPFTALVGPHSLNLITRLQTLGIQGQQGYLGMVKLLNLESLSQKISKLSLSQGVSRFSILALESGKYCIQIDANEIFFQSENELCQFIFGPTPQLKLSPDLKQKIERVFPIPLWIWGWDSI